MALLTKQSVAITGLTPTLVAAAVGGDTVHAGDTTLLMVKNGSGSPVTVTVVVPGTTYGQANPDVPVVVAAGATALVGPLTHDLAAANDLVSLTYSAVTTVTVGALEL